MRKIELKILIVALSLTLVGLIVFGGLAVIDYSWIIGWVYGTGSVLFTFLISILLIKKMFSKKRTKSTGFWLTLVRVGFVFIFQIGIILILVAVDKTVNGYGFMTNAPVSVVESPINIFTYLGGVSVVAISTIVAHILRKKGE